MTSRGAVRSLVAVSLLLGFGSAAAAPADCLSLPRQPARRRVRQPVRPAGSGARPRTRPSRPPRRPRHRAPFRWSPTPSSSRCRSSSRSKPRPAPAPAPGNADVRGRSRGAHEHGHRRRSRRLAARSDRARRLALGLDALKSCPLVLEQDQPLRPYLPELFPRALTRRRRPVAADRYNFREFARSVARTPPSRPRRRLRRIPHARAHALSHRPARRSRAPVRGALHGRRSRAGRQRFRCRPGSRAATSSASSPATSSQCAPRQRWRRCAIAKEAKELARRALHRPADGRRPGLRVRSVGARGLSRRHARLLQRRRGVPLPRRPRPTHRARSRSCRPKACALRAWRVATTLAARRTPRRTASARTARRLRRADRPSGRDGDFRARARSTPAARAHDIAITGPHPCRPASALARDLARVCQWQIDLFGGAPAAARRSIATCSRSPRSATATAASSIARARASCAAATSCPPPGDDERRRRLSSTSSVSRATSISTAGT